MLMRYTCLFFLSIPFLACADNSNVYQTRAKEKLEQLNTPVPIKDRYIRVNPETGEKQIYLDSNFVAAEALRITVNIKPGQEVVRVNNMLIQQMNSACPHGWEKVREWATPAAEGYNLHYGFYCLDQ